MSSGAGNWCLIESDPGVFSELIKGFGVDGVQVEELWGLDKENFAKLGNVHGLIFLYKWQANEEPSGSIVVDDRLDKIFFAKQVINNACATQAILSILLNVDHEEVKLGSTLDDFKSFSSSFDPQLKGLSLSNCDTIRNVHNSFARQQMFEFDASLAKDDDDVFHFVGYMPIEGRLYELDGLKEGPVDLGAVPKDSDWTDIVRPVIEQRMKKYSEGEIHFSLLAMVSDRKLALEKRIAELTNSSMDVDGKEEELQELRLQMEEEEGKRRRQRVENVRRRHNYLPFIMALLKAAAKEKLLVPLYQKAKEKGEANKKAKEERKKKLAAS